MNANHPDDIKAEATLPNAEPTAQGIRQFIDIHIYDLPSEEEAQSVESTPAEASTEATPPPEWESPLHRGQRQKRVVPAPSLVLIVLSILLIVGSSLTCYLLFFSPVTVTIVPLKKSVQTTDTVTLATGASIPESIPGRTLSSLTMSQTQAQATTGQTSKTAQPGRGTVTFYNSATYAQTIGADTLITGRDGMQVVTDYAMTVPAGTLSTNGQATVTAHTVTTGPTGNIAADDIYGPCCLLNMQAANSAFSGGQEATTYQSVAKQDIDLAVAKLQTSLKESGTAAFQMQVQPNETLVTPLSCQPSTTTDPQIGDKATQVQVTVSETCTGLTYNTQAFQEHVEEAQAIDHYRMLGNPQAVVQRVEAGNTPGTYILTVQWSATWVYQFTERELTTMASHIVGKSPREATHDLLHTSGVRQVSFSSSGNLPSDANKIHFLFLVQE